MMKLSNYTTDQLDIAVSTLFELTNLANKIPDRCCMEWTIVGLTVQFTWYKGECNGEYITDSHYIRFVPNELFKKFIRDVQEFLEADFTFQEFEPDEIGDEGYELDNYK
jgi:hypothetical protein